MSRVFTVPSVSRAPAPIARAGLGSGLRALPPPIGGDVVQRFADGAAAPGVSGDIAAIARRGLVGGARELPHRGAIEGSYGVDLGRVEAHTGTAASQACAALGARAYTLGSHVAFADRRPSLHIAAHEAAHVIQQADGVHLPGGLDRPGDVHERRADASAAAVVAGRTAPLQPAAITASTTGPVQRYTEPAIDGKNYRVADDGKMAVEQKNIYGSQIAYATPAKITAAAAQLKSAGSSITLEKGSFGVTVQDTAGKNHTLSDIVPVNKKDKSRDFDMNLWADCGRSARTVTGVDGGAGTGAGTMRAHYKNTKGKAATAGREAVETAKFDIMFVHLGSKIDATEYAKLRKDYRDARAEQSTAVGDAAKKAARAKMTTAMAALNTLFYTVYDGLPATSAKKTEVSKESLEAAAGINRFARPTVGQAYHISTGGGRHPTLAPGASTWNFHWAGVIMTTAGDSMTLENYAVGDYNVANKDWVFQMYGVYSKGGANKAGQSFHEQHRDVHKQHGAAPTTMAMGK